MMNVIIEASEAFEAIFINKINKKYPYFIQDIAYKIGVAINNHKSFCWISYPANMSLDEKRLTNKFLRDKGYKVNCDVVSECNNPPHSYYDLEKSRSISVSWYG